MNKEKKEKKYGLFKAMFGVIFIAIILTWLIPTNSFSAEGISPESMLTRVGGGLNG